MPDDPRLRALVDSELGMAILRMPTTTPEDDRRAVALIEAAVHHYREHDVDATELEGFLESCGERCTTPEQSPIRSEQQED